MKRTFLRILPLAVAVLLATSCSKDENNDNAVVNNGQETVQTKTLPISITVNQKSLSKLSCTGDMGEALQPTFEAGDKLAIYNGASLLKELAVTADNISNDGKTATFEGEIDAEGLSDGDILTATIGTPLTGAVTATSRANAVKSGCYQTAEFTYSSEGNEIQLEEQNAYIEVVWTNKGNATVSFTIDNNPVSLTLNGQGQGWIVLPAGQSVTCAALGIKEAKTTAKGNIYGITREFSAEPVYVDLGLTSGNLWAAENYSSGDKTTFTYTEACAIDGIPTSADFVELRNQCLWVWDATNKGYNVFKSKDANDKGNVTPTATYDVSTDPHIFLPAAFDGGSGIYWSNTLLSLGGGSYACCLDFTSGSVYPDNGRGVGNGYSVRLVRRSN